MGKGDKKTAKGKRSMGSFGNTRRRKTTASISVIEKPAKAEKEVKVAKPKATKAEKPAATKAAAEKAPAKKAPAKKAPAKKAAPKKDTEA
ncbi:MAG: 30S ribosomal protein THX [Bacteroidetes bacterium]|nr:30S ribosomal protein THX [Bacteroidota bacterium]